MVNDTSTLNGSLLEMKDQLIYQLGQKGVTATYDSTTGLLGLIGEISNIQPVFYDGGVTGNKNTNWTNYNNRLTVTVDSTGTLLQGHQSSNGYYLVNNSAIAYSDYVVEFDVVNITNQCYWYHQVSSSSNQNVINFASYNLSGKHIKMISQDGIMKVYADGNQIGSNISLTTSTPFEMGFRINGSSTQTRNFKYKNFVIY